MTEEYEEWLNDPVAQAEHQKWRIQDELKRAKLPDPFTTDTDVFLKAFHEIFGAKNESRS
jgi:hypothetical protein